MQTCFAVVPDDPSPDADPQPVALFVTIEDAMEWATRRYRGGSFRLRSQLAVFVDPNANAGRPPE